MASAAARLPAMMGLATEMASESRNPVSGIIVGADSFLVDAKLQTLHNPFLFP